MTRDSGTSEASPTTGQRRVRSREEPSRPAISGPRLEPGAQFIDSIAWDNVVLGAGSRVSHCIATDGVQVRAWRGVSNVILMRGQDGTAIAIPFSAEKR